MIKKGIKAGIVIFTAKITYVILDSIAGVILESLASKAEDVKKDLEEEGNEEDGED